MSISRGTSPNPSPWNEEAMDGGMRTPEIVCMMIVILTVLYAFVIQQGANKAYDLVEGVIYLLAY